MLLDLLLLLLLMWLFWLPVVPVDRRLGGRGGGLLLRCGNGGLGGGLVSRNMLSVLCEVRKFLLEDFSSMSRSLWNGNM